jgi:hypothetical protein
MRTSLSLLAATAIGAALVAGTAATSIAAPARHTHAVVVRPVHRDGKPVAGWTVTKQKIQDFRCDEGASPVAVDPGIRFCGFSATYTVACWKSTHHTALCLRNPRKQVLARIRYDGRFGPVSAPKHATPQAFALFGGGYCEIRDGGAWGEVKGHPNWSGDDSCTNGAAVYGPGRDGINRSHQPWSVHLVRFHNNSQSIHVRQLRTVYYAGTAS